MTNHISFIINFILIALMASSQSKDNSQNLDSTPKTALQPTPVTLTYTQASHNEGINSLRIDRSHWITQDSYVYYAAASVDTLVLYYTAWWINGDEQLSAVYRAAAGNNTDASTRYFGVTVNDCHETADRYEIDSLPTVVIVKYGAKVASFTGRRAGDLKVFLERYGGLKA